MHKVQVLLISEAKALALTSLLQWADYLVLLCPLYTTSFPTLFSSMSDVNGISVKQSLSFISLQSI
jgi:hypothetical protein